MARRDCGVHPGDRWRGRVSSRQTLEVLLEGADGPLTVHADNRDYVAWDMVAPQKKWPKMGDAPILASTYLAWHCLKRQGLYGDTFDRFRMEDCVSVEVVGEPVAVDPTPPAPTAG